MSQYDFGTIDPYVVDGVQLAAMLNQWRDAVHAMHRGAARPSYAVPGMLWVNDNGGPTNWIVYVYLGPAIGDKALWAYNTTTGAIAIAGGISLPGGPFMPLSGGQMIGAISTSASNIPAFIYNGTSGTYRYSRYASNDKPNTTRWDIGVDDVAETGGEAGSSFFFSRWSDAGVSLGRVLVLGRAGGASIISSGSGKSLDIGGTDNLDSLRIFNSAGTKFVTIKPEVAANVAQIMYWNGGGPGTLFFPGVVITDPVPAAEDSNRVATTSWVRSIARAAVAIPTYDQRSDQQLCTGWAGGDAIMQITHGTQIFSRSFTALNAAHAIEVNAVMYPGAGGAGVTPTVGLFIDGAAAAVTQASTSIVTVQAITTVPLYWQGVLSAGAHTFTLRCAGSPGNCYSNGNDAGRYGGGALRNSMTIREIG